MFKIVNDVDPESPLNIGSIRRSKPVAGREVNNRSKLSCFVCSCIAVSVE